MDLSQKTPFAVTMTHYIQNKIDTNQEFFGWQLPCRVTKVEGSIVTINFEVAQNEGFNFPEVQCAIAQSTYVRLPVQVGDLGICLSANARLGGINGLGNGLAPLATPLNLEGLIYVPIGNLNWSAVDPNAVNINAPNGVVIRDTENNCTITLLPTGVTVAIGSTSLIVDGTGVIVNGKFTVNGNVETTGTLKNNGVSVGSTHKHSGIQTGTSNTGNPV